MKHLFDKQNKYSIRKLSIGVCSAVIGLSFLSAGTAYAEGPTQPATEPVTGQEAPASDQAAPAEATQPAAEVQPAPVSEAGPNPENTETAAPVAVAEPVKVPVFVDVTATEASSNVDGRLPSHAVDGNDNTYFQTSPTPGANEEQGLVVRLQEPATVEKLTYRPAVPASGHLPGLLTIGRVDYKLAEEDEWQAATVTALKDLGGTSANHHAIYEDKTFKIGANNNIREIILAPIEAQFIRLVGIQSWAGRTDLENRTGLFTVSELKVDAHKTIADSDVVRVKADATTATSYNSGEGAAPTKATDGVISDASYWASASDQNNLETPQTLTIELNEAAYVDHVLYTPRQFRRMAGTNGSVKAGKIEFSQDGQTFYPVTHVGYETPDGFNLPLTHNTSKITFEPVFATHLRLTATEGYNAFNPATAGRIVSASEFTTTGRKFHFETAAVVAEPTREESNSYYKGQEVPDPTTPGVDGSRLTGRVFLTENGQKTGEAVADFPQMARELERAVPAKIFVGTNEPTIAPLSQPVGTEITDQMLRDAVTGLPENASVTEIVSRPTLTLAGPQTPAILKITYPGPAAASQADVVSIEVPVTATATTPDPIVTETPVGINRVEATTTNEGWGVKENVIDGRTDTEWASAWVVGQNTPENPQRLTVHLDEVATVSKISYAPRWRNGQNGKLITGYIEYTENGEAWNRLTVTGITGGHGVVLHEDKSFTIPNQSNNNAPMTINFDPVQASAFRLMGLETFHENSAMANQILAVSEFKPIEAIKRVETPAPDVIDEVKVVVRTEPIAITTRYDEVGDPEKYTDEETEVSPGREGVRTFYQNYETRNGVQTSTKIGEEYAEETTQMEQRVVKRGTKERPVAPAPTVAPVRYATVLPEALRVDQGSDLTESQIAAKITFPAGVTGTVSLGDVAGVTASTGNKEVSATVTYTAVKAPVTVDVTSVNEGWAANGNAKENVLTEDPKTFWASAWSAERNTDSNREYITLDFGGEVEVAKVRYQSHWNVSQHGQITRGYIEYKDAAGQWQKLDLTGVTGGTGISFDDKHFVVANPSAAENLKPVTFEVTPVRAQAIRLAGVVTNGGPNNSGSHMVSASTFYALVNHTETVMVPVEVVEVPAPQPDVIGRQEVVVRTEPIAITTRYDEVGDPEKYTDEETEVSPGREGLRTIFQAYETVNGVPTDKKLGDERVEETRAMEQRVVKRGTKERPVTPPQVRPQAPTVVRLANGDFYGNDSRESLLVVGLPTDTQVGYVIKVYGDNNTVLAQATVSEDDQTASRVQVALPSLLENGKSHPVTISNPAGLESEATPVLGDTQAPSAPSAASFEAGSRTVQVTLGQGVQAGDIIAVVNPAPTSSEDLYIGYAEVRSGANGALPTSLDVSVSQDLAADKAYPVVAFDGVYNFSEPITARVRQVDAPKPDVPTPPVARTFEDSSSKVKVVVPAEETQDITGLRVVHLETGHAEAPASLADKDYDLYDIELVNSQGNDVDITRPATVTLPVDAGKTVEQVLYLPETGTPDPRPFTEATENGQKVVTFTAEHFSKYSILYRSVAVPVAYPPVESVGEFERDAAAVGRITNLTFANGRADITFETGQKAQLSFYNDHVFRYHVDKEGNFPEHPALVHAGRPATITLKDQAAYQSTYGQVGKLVEEESRYILETEKVLVIFDKATSRMSVFDRLKNEYVTKEVEPVKLTPAKTTQTLSQGENEQFFGGGMQNGRFTHKGNKIRIVNENNWVDNGVASPAPFYWSSNGYGVLRNTFMPGQYDFGTEDTSKLTSDHNEERFDAYYFVNSKPADILKDYYELTGKPAVLPLYALYLGHLNAYNRDYWREVPEGTRGAVRQGDGKWYREFDGRNHTPEAGDVKETLNGENGSYEFSARKVIERYKDADMPLSWFLPNDGYGAGYGQGANIDENIENLKQFVEFAKTQGIAVGLWTQADLFSSAGAPVLHRDIEKEVAVAGIRAIKTDVAWVGPGYNFGLNGVDEGARNLTERSGADKARPFIVSLDGWAGTQRSAAIWSGDQSGGEWEYIRFHIPTYLGLGLSGNPNIGSDMDGIFGGGNPIINARDYQWKTFTSILMNMDGWGREPKMPFAFGDAHPTTDVNRMSLKLKSTLIPYAYSTGHQASEDGKPILRAMFFETPEEAMAYTKAVQYQYMYGDNFLVAPVYEPTALKENGDDIRNNIFLPAGSEWLDFYTGKKYEGGQVLNGLEAPLWKIPVFVKNGAIVPMANAHNNPSELDKTNRLITFYPHGTTSFKHYEDDGTSVDYKSGKVATTLIESTAGDSNTKGTAVLKINRTQGEFDGMVKNKTTELHVNVSEDVTSVEATVNGQAVTLRRVSTLDEYNNGTNVFFYHNDPTMATYAPKSDQFKNLSVTMNDLLKVKLAASDVTAGDTVVTINGFINKKEEVTVPAGLEKPAVPTNLATPEAFVTATSMKVSWSPSDRAETYDLLHNDVLYTNIKGTEFTFKDFTPGSEHTYKVRAVNAKGVSDWSDAVTTQTSEDPWLNAIDIEPTRVSTNIVAQGGQGIDKLVNKQKGDQFHSQWSGTVPQNPYIRVDLGGIYDLDYVEYHQRGDGGVNGRVTWARFYVSEDGENWTQTGAEDWRGDGNLKRHTLNARGRYVHMAIEGHHGQWVSGEELLIFKKPGTKMLVPGDINNDGRINEDDKTSFMNYSGLRTEDNDFQYIQHVDSNKNGIIDAADISVIATQLDGGITSPSTVAPSGNLRFEAEKLTAVAGEEIKVYLVAEDLAAVNALTSTFQVNGDDFEVVRNVVVPETFVKQAENFSQIRTRGTTVDAVFSFVNFGQKDLLSGSGRVAYLTLKAKRAASLNFTSDNGVLVGNDLRNAAVADQPVVALVNYTAAPAVPTAVTVARPTHGSVTLSWTASDNAARYVIEQEGEDGQFVEVGRSNTTSFNVYNLAPETSYKFRVRATNPLGESANTDLVTGTTVAKDITNKLTPVAQAANTPEQPSEGLARFFDGDESTIYHSQWGKTDAVPSSLIIDLGEAKALDRLIYVPRPAASNGTITGLTLETSNDGETWAPTGETIRWTRNRLDKIALFPRGTESRYIRVNWTNSVGGFVSGQELYVIASTEPIPPAPDTPTPDTPAPTFRDGRTEFDFTVERIPVAFLDQGQEQVLREGQNGYVIKTFKDTVVNGQTRSELHEIKDFRLPLSKVILVGTRPVVTTTSRQVIEALEFTVERIPVTHLDAGVEVVVREGVAGRLTKVYEDSVTAGAPAVSRLVEVKDRVAPINKLVLLGTRPVVTTRTALRDDRQVLAFQVERVEDSSLARGQEELVREGVNGLLVKVFEDTFINDVKASERFVEVKEFVRPVNQLVRVGTRPVVTSRAETRDVVETLPATVERVAAPALPAGVERVLRQGRPGRVTKVYEDTFINDVKTSERLLELKDIVTPVNTLVLVGSAAAEQPGTSTPVVSPSPRVAAPALAKPAPAAVQNQAPVRHFKSDETSDINSAPVAISAVGILSTLGLIGAKKKD